MKIRTLLGAIACSVAALTATSTASAADYKSEYKMSLVVGTTFPWGQGGQIWADLVRERTDGRINIKLYPGVSLVQGDQTREFTAIRQGLIDMAIGSTINWSPQVKQLNLFSLPFLMPDYAAIDALIHGQVGKDLFDIVEKAGVVPLAWGENGYRQLSNSKREVKAPDDLKGMKLRVVGSPLYIDTFTAMGANPTQMSWADAQPALATGAVDGQENPLSIYAGAKLYDVAQKYLTLWNYVADPLIFVVNKQVWESWTEEDRKIVREAAVEAGKQQIVIARKGVTQDDASMLKDIESHGVTVTHLTPEQHDAFVKATQPVFDKWKKTVGEDLVSQAQKDIAARKK
ncbi:DctP family TRAP transporter solute-binding subunit [Pollutimonas thiosulfatoxidans]|uniref:C4-dicarboxylate ABC transporter n=1 Tax=Pollutimonas thiosulfatoxidans TaxID=2028345 RepID=A0A410GF30_9BURK|nr:DctP family TRAP transporter solute-binding subunit [Pollutimonas thiosulfatoxidans]MBF6617181.1 DctP family TRAP transporter solute-binding subunit [Candidimonas sp.]NYT45715.1 DctP family TRAP transporter solute-binding subunit [Alcaligenaceae bacterium]QAA94879.1 C4-dicarboxylate ABC transporter [Pollutimonas thiosulfatoxidans]